MSEEIILCVDPGREKCGLAIVSKSEGVLLKIVIDTNLLRKTAEQLIRDYGAQTIVLGDRTFSGYAKEAFVGLKSNDVDMPIIFVDEHRSSEEARERYWRDNPPKGLLRLLPVTMQTPPVPIDDYVALILAERYFERQ